jgi:glycosyltransferase involved in cell wall biosynthesis
MTDWLLVHPSDEMYGADRVLLEVVDALGASSVTGCWLPTDVAYPKRLLSNALGDRGVAVDRPDLPVLRREYLNGRGMLALAARTARSSRYAHSRRLQIENVYLNTSAVLPMAPVLKRRGRRVICHVHEHWGRAERRILGPLLRFCDATIAVSEAVAEQLPGRPTVVHNGFPEGKEPVVAPPDGPLRVLLASRWSSWKGHREFLAAWQKAARPDAHLTIVGGPPPSGNSVDVPALVRALGLGGTVTVEAERSNIDDLIQGSHVVAVPSIKADPLPTIAIEALRAARPVLASNSGGLTEIVTHGVTGWLAPPGDVNAWALAIQDLDHTTAASFGRAARKDFLQRFAVGRFRSELRRIAYE